MLERRMANMIPITPRRGSRFWRVSIQTSEPKTAMFVSTMMMMSLRVSLKPLPSG